MAAAASDGRFFRTRSKHQACGDAGVQTVPRPEEIRGLASDELPNGGNATTDGDGGCDGRDAAPCTK
jgi:hypothetical protein